MLLFDGISSWLKFKLILYHEAYDCPDICHKGKRQSPIAVCKEYAKNVNIPPLEFYYYCKRYEACVENCGHSVIIRLENDDQCEVPTMTGGHLNGEFVIDNISFHWEGEHTINGKRYPLEAHLVHFNKKCQTFEDALKHPEGLIILAVMFRLANCHNPKLNNLVTSTEKVAKKIKKPGPITDGIVVDHFLPKNRRTFYTYEGSLTTPECNENVRWIIFEEILPIGDDQLHRLTNIVAETGEPLTTNSRSLQEEHKREVLYTSDTLSVKSIKAYVKEKLGLRS